MDNSKYLYNSAIGNKASYLNEIKGTQYYEDKDNKIFANDVIKFLLPKEYDVCDVLYSEPPFPQGLKVFENRAKIKKNRTYNEFADSLNKIIMKNKKPIFMIMGKILLKKLLPPKQILEINLSFHNIIVNLAIWNYDINPNTKTTNDLMIYLAKNFKCMGDFCCGYGDNVAHFMNNGGINFVASDLDPKCISIVKKRMFQ